MTGTELLPCPFCGGEADYALGYGAACTNPTCGAGVPCRGDDFTPWNRRSDLCASDQQVRALDKNGDLLGSPLEHKLRAEFRRAAKHHGIPLNGVFEADVVRAFLAALTPAPQAEEQVREAAHRILELYDEALRWLLDPGVHDSHPDSREMAELRRIVGAPAHDWSPAPSAATPTAQEAVPVAHWKDHCRAKNGPEVCDAPCTRCMSAGYAVGYRVRVRSDDPEEWEYMSTAQALDWMERENIEAQPLHAHPPQPSETVAEAATHALDACRIIDAAVLEGHDNVSDLICHFLEAVEPARAALRALKGGSDNG